MAKKLNIASLQPKIIMEPVANDDKRYIRCHILIVCEGEKTEPNYFRSFSMMENSSGLVYQVDTQGGKISTTQVVDKAIALKQEAEKVKKPYDAVWQYSIVTILKQPPLTRPSIKLIKTE